MKNYQTNSFYTIDTGHCWRGAHIGDELEHPTFATYDQALQYAKDLFRNNVDSNFYVGVNLELEVCGIREYLRTVELFYTIEALEEVHN